MSDDVLLPIVAEIRIAAPIERTWEALTSAAIVPGWLGCLDYRAEEGTTFFMQLDPSKRAANETNGATHCDVLLLKRPHKFDFSWYVPGTSATLVEVSVFSEGPAKSFLRLVHGGWEQFAADGMRALRDQLAAGWRDDVLPRLKAAAEGN